MNSNNPFKVVVYCLLIRGMLSHQDEFPMVSTLVCMITHLTRLMVNHDISYRVVMIH